MLVNKTQKMQVIKIMSRDGKIKDSINLVRKVELPAGFIVDPDFVAEYASLMTDTSQTSTATAAQQGKAKQ